MSSVIVCILSTCALLFGVEGMYASVTPSGAQAIPADKQTALIRSEEAHPDAMERHDLQKQRQAAHAHADPAPAAKNASNKVTIDVYYETKCPGCIMFINSTLEPLWRTAGIKDLVQISLFTYGNGMTIPVKNISEGYKFWHPDTTGAGYDNVHICQHGNDECFGNLVQVCAKDIAEQDKYMELVFCMTATTMQGYSMEKSSYDCMHKADINPDAIKGCVRGPKGNELMTKTGEKTNELQGRLGTPWVMIQGAHAADDLMMNSTLLLQAVCGHVGNVPVPCAAFKNAPAPAPKAAEPAPDEGDDFQVFGKLDMYKVTANQV